MRKILFAITILFFAANAYAANISNYTDIVTMQSDDKIYVLRDSSTTPVNRDLDYSVLLTNILSNFDTEAEFEAALFAVVTPAEDDDVPEAGDFGAIDTEAEFEAALFAVVTPAEDDDVPEAGDFGAIDTEAEFEAALFAVVTPAEDDDVPEAGDFGAIDTEAEFEAALFAVVTPAEDDDVPDSGDLGLIDTEAEFESELFAIVTPAELPTIPFKAKVAFEDPVDTDDFGSIDYTDNAVTLTKIYCETDTGTVNLDINIDDGTPAGVNGSSIACGASGTLDSTLAGDTTYGAGEKLDLAIASVSGTPGYLTVIIMGDYD